jgi:hypothetical protein
LIERSGGPINHMWLRRVLKHSNPDPQRCLSSPQARPWSRSRP